MKMMKPMKLWYVGLLAAGLLPAAATAAPAAQQKLAPAKRGPVDGPTVLHARAARQLLQANLPPEVIVPLCLSYLPPQQGAPGADAAALRVLAIDVLAQCGARASAAVPRLFALAADPAEPPAVRHAALRTLAALSPPIPLLAPTLTGALQDTSLPPATRSAVIEGLGRLGPAARQADPALVRALIAGLDHQDTGVGYAAFTALSAVPSVMTFGPARRAPGAPTLAQHIERLDRLDALPPAAASATFAVLQAAAAGTGAASAAVSAAVPRLLLIAERGSKPFHRVAALQTLVRLRPPASLQTLSVLLRALAGADEVVAQAAEPVVLRLGPAQPSSAARPLAESLAGALGHKEARVRHVAARALAARSSADLPAEALALAPALARALSLCGPGTPPEHLRTCAGLLHDLGPRAASAAGTLLVHLRPGSPLLQNPATSQLCRAYLLGALARVGVPVGAEPAALAAALAGLKDSGSNGGNGSGSAFAAGARLAGQLGRAGAPAVPHLLGALAVDFIDTGVDRTFHPVAASGNGGHGGESGATSSARREAIRALGQIGAGAASAVLALHQLAQALEGEDQEDALAQELAIEVAQALEAIGDAGPAASPVVASVTSAPLSAGSMVRIGQPVPPFTLTDLSGTVHGPSGWRGNPVLLVFVDAACPCVPAYDVRIKALHTRYSTQGLQIVYVFAGAADTAVAVRRLATARSYPWTSAHEAAGQPLARLFGARVTTEVCLVDKEGVLRYRGRIDDNIFDAAAVKERSLEAAVESVLAGRPVLKPETTAFGCALALASAPGG